MKMEEAKNLEQREVSYNIKDFVGVYHNFFSKEYCEKVIDYFNLAEKAGLTGNRQSHDKALKTYKDDSFLFCSGTAHIDPSFTTEFLNKFWGTAYPLYVREYAILTESGRHNIYDNKLQKTLPGQGYHVWHYEASDRSCANRLLAYIVYLNNVEEGGETEFLYLGKRIKPTAGTLVIWPAAFTHTHRGNPPLSGEKYIMTGWVEF
jgi:hypothetical protein